MVNLVGLCVVGGFGAVGAYAAYSAYWLYEIEHIEKPKYTVVKGLKTARTWLGKEVNSVELRHYEGYLIAEIEVRSKPMKKAMSEGFMTVARFIFGGNTAVDKPDTKEPIAMTSPVRMVMPEEQAEKLAKSTEPPRRPASDETAPLTEADADSVYKISFVMPSKYNKDTLPRPDNAEVAIKEVSAHDMAAISFNGPSPSPKVIEQKRLELLAAMKLNGLEPQGDVLIYQYHPPFAPNWMRVNEVLYMIKA